VNKNVKLEICLDSAESAVISQENGADRVELCDNLLQGGTTPSTGVLRVTRKNIEIGLQVIIRPRGGDFLYSKYEYEAMKEDIKIAGEEGADGVVFGILSSDGTIDVERNAELVSYAHPMNCTFHRAFDVVRDSSAALEEVIELGFDRILTSGQEATVLEGAPRIIELIQQAGDRIIIMPGNGITSKNIERISDLIGAQEYHVAVDHVRESGMSYRPGGVYMGGFLRPPEFLNTYTDPVQVHAIKNLI